MYCTSHVPLSTQSTVVNLSILHNLPQPIATQVDLPSSLPTIIPQLHGPSMTSSRTRSIPAQTRISPHARHDSLLARLHRAMMRSSAVRARKVCRHMGTEHGACAVSSLFSNRGEIPYCYPYPLIAIARRRIYITSDRCPGRTHSFWLQYFFPLPTLPTYLLTSLSKNLTYKKLPHPTLPSYGTAS